MQEIVRGAVPSLGWDDPLEESMATRSGILAWRIPWTEEPGGLQSRGDTKSQTWLKQLCTFSTGHVCVSCSCFNLSFILFIKQRVWIGSIFMEEWCKDHIPVDLLGTCGVTSLLLNFRSLIIFCDCRKPPLRQLIGFSVAVGSNHRRPWKWGYVWNLCEAMYRIWTSFFRSPFPTLCFLEHLFHKRKGKKVSK